MNKITKNASWIIACKLAQSILNLFVSMITARFLGPSNYGLITYAHSIVAFIVPLVQLGINAIYVQEIVDNPDCEGEIVGTATLLTSISSLLGILGLWAFTSIVNKNEQETILVVLIYSLSLFFQMTEMVQYWYQSKLMSKYVSIVSLISRFLVSIYKIYIVISGKNIYWFAVVNSLDFLMISVALYAIYFRLGGQRLDFSKTKAVELLSNGRYFVLAGLMVSVFSQTDRIMLKLMINDAESGFYSAAISCAGMTVFVFTAVMDSFRPVVFGYKRDNQEKYRNSLIRLYSIIIYMALVQSVVLTLFAKRITILIYGEQYSPSVGILRIITWYSAFSYLGSARYIWFISENKQKYIWRIDLIGAVCNVIGNLTLIPLLGARGAALASLLTQVITNFVLNFVFEPFRENGIYMLKALNPIIIWNMCVGRKR